jgi:hypothetical protein
MIEIASPRMSPMQLELIECALRVLTQVSPLEWDEIPPELHRCFEKYMERDVWTGVADSQTVREAAVMILRDAIAHRGEFGGAKA